MLNLINLKEDASGRKMAEETETTEVEKDEDTRDEDDYVLSGGEYKPRRISADLYRQQKQAQARQAATAGGLALAGEVGQFFVGLSTMNDPTIKAARRDLARLEAKTRESGPLITEAEKMDMRQAAMAPVMRAQESLERKAQNIAAASGDASARTFLKAAKVGLGDVRQQALNVEAKISQEKVRRATARDERIERARGQADSIRAMMLDLRNTYVREPLHKFIGDAAKYTGTVLAYAPERSYEDELEKAMEGVDGITAEDMVKLRSLANRPFATKRMLKIIKEIKGRGTTPDSGEEVEGEASKARERKETQAGIAQAEKAVAATRGQTPEVVDSGEVQQPYDVPIEEMTEAQSRKAAGLDEKTMRDIYKDVARPGLETKGKLYQKRADEDFVYGYTPYGPAGEPAWYIYRNNKFLTPFVPTGMKGNFFTLEETKNHPNDNVKELYQLGMEKGLY